MNDQQLIACLKGLVLDGVNAAQSGHPGGAMSSMDFAYILYSEYLRFDPEDPKWIGRDRFVLSAGHESMLLYSILHMIGWLDKEELKRFRQWKSLTPGHPESHLTPGVECTTGPLGQGAAMSVGMAIAHKHLASVWGEALFGGRTYALLGDGCMQEDVTLGAASLAGHLGMSNLIWYYDRNRIQISGGIEKATSDDERKVFEGFGWKVTSIDGHDHQQMRQVLDEITKGKSDRPQLIIGNTTIAKGAYSVEGSHKTHGAPFKDDELKKTKAKLGLPENTDFYSTQAHLDYFRRNFDQHRLRAQAWKDSFKKLQQDAPGQAKFEAYFGKVNSQSFGSLDWQLHPSIATRNVFGMIIEAWAEQLPSLVGGSADLAPSNMTEAFAKKVGDFAKTNRGGRNIEFGVREFPMSAICNGIALHGGLIAFDATFLTFSDYARPALRLGALQGLRVIHEYSHDSFYLGEDGPTHQSIEHVMSLRLIPEFYVMRPADAWETEVMMRQAIELQRPSAICLTRQKVKTLSLSAEQRSQCARGAYILRDAADTDAVIFATGSEVGLAMEVAEQWPDARVRVVSVPCWELFFDQDQDYQDQILDWSIPRRISIEAGCTLGWQRFVGHRGLSIGIDHFGDSAPAEKLALEYGFTPEQVIQRALEHRWS